MAADVQLNHDKMVVLNHGDHVHRLEVPKLQSVAVKAVNPSSFRKYGRDTFPSHLHRSRSAMDMEPQQLLADRKHKQRAVSIQKELDELFTGPRG